MALTYRLPDWIFVDFRHDLNISFSRSNMEFRISQPKMVRLPWNKKRQIYPLNSTPQLGPSGLTWAMHDLNLEFSRSIMEFAISQPIMVLLPRTKSKHINSTLGLNWDHWVRPWPCPWPWVFKVKYGIGYISAKNGPIAMKWRANISIEL